MEGEDLICSDCAFEACSTECSLVTKHHNIDACEGSRGADKLFRYYEEDRDDLVFMMENSVDELASIAWNADFPLSADKRCGCNMGEGEKRSFFTCSQCTNLRRVMDFRKGLSESFTIQCGSFSGRKFIVKKDKVGTLFLKKSGNVLRGDKLTMATMLHIYLQNKCGKHILFLYDAFICSDSLFSLYEDIERYDIHNASEKSIKSQHSILLPIEKEIVLNIVLQLLITLNTLSAYQFFLGNPGVDSLVFLDKSVSYKYGNIEVVAPMSLTIQDFTDVSATIKNVRFQPAKQDWKTFPTELITKKERMIEFYRLNSENRMFFIESCHNGSKYAKSFNFYSLMLVLLSDKSFYDSMDQSVWYNMWSDEDRSTVERRLKIVHEDETENKINIYSVLYGTWLRTDIVEYILSENFGLK